ncbi:MAG: PDC sensor domain-containing protein [Campylobacterales bacterium]
MKRIVNQFRDNRHTIEMFLRNRVQADRYNFNDEKGIHAAFEHLPFLEMFYIIGSDLKQISPNYFRKGKDESLIGRDKSHYFTNINLEKFTSYVTNPYIHHITGESSITMVMPYRNDTYIVFDFNLLKLLETLRLIQHNSRFERFNLFVYALGGFLLALVALFLIVYGAYTFAVVFFHPPDEVLHDIFKAIIAITLGLAIFDLSKTILENEVMYKNAGKQNEGQYTVLGKFLVSIIIALSIESLMVVFKITLGDYTGLGYGFLLILGVTLMIVGLGWFDHLTKKRTAEEE